MLTVPPPQSVSRQKTGWMIALALAFVCAIGTGAQAPTIDTSAIGPKVGERVPGFSGTDQFGKPHTLESSLGPNGAMLVFFRSADW
jgi:hypothetical protein